MTPVLHIRAIGFILSVAMTIGASVAIRTVDSSPPPEVLAQEALRQDNPDVPKSVLQYTEALRREVASPYRWADLGAAYRAANDLDRARSCYQRALKLSGGVPQIWLRVAHFHFDQGEYEDAVSLSARVLETVPDYDEVLFTYFDHWLPDPDPVFRAIGSNRRIMAAYTQHLINSGNMKAASLSWHRMQRSKWNDSRLTASYIDGMLRAHRYANAREDWVASVGPDCGEYPLRNLLFDGGFEREAGGSPLAWRIEPSEQFETARDSSIVHSGKWSLRIKFLGNENVEYANLSQTTWVTPGRYFLRAWIRADSITTNEGLRLELDDAEVPARLALKTEPITGTSNWRPIEQSFTIGPYTNLLMIRVVRDHSRKFDSKISGAAWIDDISLRRL